MRSLTVLIFPPTSAHADVSQLPCESTCCGQVEIINTVVTKTSNSFDEEEGNNAKVLVPAIMVGGMWGGWGEG